MTRQHGPRAENSPKYNISVQGSQGIVVGDNAHVTNIFRGVAASQDTLSREQLLAAIRRAGSDLRGYRNTVAGVHIDRPETQQIVDWTLSSDTKKPLAILIDQPGAGKSVVMRDVLERLEAQEIPVLGIKADMLSGIRSRGELIDRLCLPIDVEECARILGTEDRLVVLLDQLDALSLALSRDHVALGLVLGTLSRLCDLGNVRVVASCRTFDLHNDPRLSQLRPAQQFQLQPLNDAEVDRVLKTVAVAPERLLPAMRALLRTPLHLDVYSRVVAGGHDTGQSESVRSLQELYEALWQKCVVQTPPVLPPTSERTAAIYRLVEFMQSQLHPQLTAPIAVLDGHESAAGYLEREGLIRRERGNWLFMHQTFFDYCYARRFVVDRRSLSQEILDGPQGLFERSQMLQVLAYLRSAKVAEYNVELRRLLFSTRLRPHMRLLLIGWIGSLPAPSQSEVHIARELMASDEDRRRFLRSSAGNVDWLDRLNGAVLPALLHRADTADEALYYLDAVISHRTEDVLALLQPFLRSSEEWDYRIARCISRLHDWTNPQAIDVLCDLLERERMGQWGDYCFGDLAKTNAEGGCRALRIHLDRRVKRFLKEDQEYPDGSLGIAGSETRKSGVVDWRNRLFDEHFTMEFVEVAAQTCPEALIEHVLPWFCDAAESLSEQYWDDHYPSDLVFAWHWYGDHVADGSLFALGMAAALKSLAAANPEKFRPLANKLATVEALAVQRLLVQAYLVAPELYAQDIYAYLGSDPRHLSIGEESESPRYESCQLCGAVFSHLSEKQRLKLEALILGLQPRFELRHPRSSGQAQLEFLQSMPRELLSTKASRRLEELQRKFPGFALHKPVGVIGGPVGPPIDVEAQAKMSDSDWLSAMHHYDDSTGWGFHRDLLKGGIIQLSQAFAEQVKAAPGRFYPFALRFDDSIPVRYVEAAITGLAESDASSEWVFELARKHSSCFVGESRRSVCRALEKRAEAKVPDDLLDLMTDWATSDPDPGTELPLSNPPGPDPLLAQGINTNRGVAVRTVSTCSLYREPPQVDRAFSLLERAARDPSNAVRACVVERLRFFLKEDAVRAIAIFRQTSGDSPELMQNSIAWDFLHRSYYHHFHEVQHFIECLLESGDEQSRQAGARLGCLAAFQHPEAKQLADRALDGDEVARRGAAEVYAYNLHIPKLESICRERLLILINDPDTQVRRLAGGCFDHLGPEHLDRLRDFVLAFAQSPALKAGAENLVRYLAPAAVDDQELSSQVAVRVLEAVSSKSPDERWEDLSLEDDLVTLILTIYMYTDDSAVRAQSLDLFERLLDAGCHAAQQALKEWDRR